MTKEEVIEAVRGGVISLKEIEEELLELTESDKDNICLMHLLFCEEGHDEGKCEFFSEERLDNTWSLKSHLLWKKSYKDYKTRHRVVGSEILKELVIINSLIQEARKLNHTPELIIRYVHNMNKG